MPKISEIFSARFLKVEHLNGKSRSVIIESWEQEEAYGEQQYVIYFEGERRGCGLNGTNGGDIAKLYGDDLKDWAGHQIELYPAQMEITDKETKAKKTIDIIRARAPASAPTPSSPKSAKSISAPTKSDIDDDIPF